MDLFYLKLDLHGYIAPVDYRRFRPMLAAGPWCWPPEGGPAWERARKIHGASPPEVPVGASLLVSVQEGVGASLHLVRTRSPLGKEHLWGRERHSVYLESKARDAWSNALGALPRSLPFLWHSLQKIAGEQPVTVSRLNHIELEREGKKDKRGQKIVEVQRDCKVIDGYSFGLAFALSMASALLDHPLPQDVMGLACVDVEGRCQKVDALEEKLLCLQVCTPGVRRVLVAQEQKEDACQIIEQRKNSKVSSAKESPLATTRGRSSSRASLKKTKGTQAEGSGSWQIIGVRHLLEALEEVWGEQLEEALTCAAGDDSSRQEIIRSLFSLALSASRGVAFDWHPVCRMARLVQDRWKPEDEEEAQIRFVEAVAQRYVDKKRQVHFAVTDLLRQKLPQPHKVIIAAQWVQQATDTGYPQVKEAEDVAKSFWVEDLLEAFPEHLKLTGALARLQAVTGRTNEALQKQEALAWAWLERHVYDIYDLLSYPLAEWFRLSAVLEDGEALKRAEEFWQRVSLLCGLTEEDPRPFFVEKARAQALILFAEKGVFFSDGFSGRDGFSGQTAPGKVTVIEQSRKKLEQIRQERNAYNDVRFSAARWELRALEVLRKGERLSDETYQSKREEILCWKKERLEQIKKDGLLHKEPNAHLFQTLMELDRAVLQQNTPAAQKALQRWREIQPYPLGLIEKHTKKKGKEDLSWIAEVATLYPY